MSSSSRHKPGSDEVQIEIDLELSLPRKRDLLRVDEVMDILRCERDHVYRLIDNGELTALDNKSNPNGKQSYYLVTRASLVAFVNRRKIS